MTFEDYPDYYTRIKKFMNYKGESFRKRIIKDTSGFK